jgi:hypothetical protein
MHKSKLLAILRSLKVLSVPVWIHLSSASTQQKIDPAVAYNVTKLVSSYFLDSTT